LLTALRRVLSEFALVRVSVERMQDPVRVNDLSLGFSGTAFSDLASWWKLVLKPVRIRRKRSTRTTNQIMTERAHINDEELSYFTFRHHHLKSLNENRLCLKFKMIVTVADFWNLRLY